MGDRALIVFAGDNKGHQEEPEFEVSPIVYLHWAGEAVPEMLKELATVMEGREGDVQYSCARFIAIAAAFIPGNLSVGIWNSSEATIPVE